MTGHDLREEDEVEFLFPARTLDTILFFTDKGKVYSEKTHRIPQADRNDRGSPVANVLSVSPGETVTAAVAVPSFASGRLLHDGHPAREDQARIAGGI